MFKKLFSVLVIVVIILTMMNVVSNGKYVMAVNSPEGYEIIEESGNYILLFNDETVDIAIKDKNTGYLWRAFQMKQSLI